MFFMRALVRYWFIAPILLIVLAVQLGLGFVVANNVIGTEKTEANTLAHSVSNTVANSVANSPESKAAELPALRQTIRPMPTHTPTPSSTPSPSLTPTVSPTFTPSPTRTQTPLPTDTPLATDTPLPSATPTSTHTPTPEPQPTPIVRNNTQIVPILMYHYLSTSPPGADAIRQDLSVSPEQFESHLAYLRQAGYETISMEQLSVALSGQADLPPKPVIITFDDGYRDNYENAFPLLRKYGYAGTFFVFTQVIDEYNIRFLTWEMVTEMHKAGMEFGSHSYSHPDMVGKSDEYQIFEVLASKEAIEERTGQPVRFFAYPSGRYDQLTIQVLNSAHFWGAVTTQWGAEQSYNNRFEMPRIRVRGNDTADDLAQKLDIFAE